MDFGKALEAVKSGKKIFRLGWNGKGMFVVYQKGYPDGIPCNLQTERKDGYKEQGMKSLLKQVANKVSVYGDTAVCNLIDECMSNGWKGIIWDKLQSSSAYRNSGDRIGNRVKDVDGW